MLAKERDGVGRDILKDYLSGEGLLDRIAGNIETVIAGAKVQDRQIDGAKQGRLKTRAQCEAQVNRFQTLLKDVEEGYASGEAYSLRQRKEGLATQVETLEKAKRYHAGQLAGQVQRLESEKGELPTEGDLARLEADVTTWESNKAEIETKTEKLQELESTSPDFEWASKADRLYKDATSGAAGGGPKKVFMLLALLSFTGTVAFGLLGLRIPLILSAVLSALFGAITYLNLKKAASYAGENTELAKLKAEYRTRFGSDLTDQATLLAKLGELNKNEILATPLREARDVLSEETCTLERTTTATLKDWTGNEVPVEEWRKTIRALTERIDGLQSQIDSIGQELGSVGVPRHEYVEEDPGREWDSERYAELTGRLHVTREAVEKEEKNLEGLKTRVAQETGREDSDWEELITALSNKRGEAAQEYREVTAEILAKIQVNAVIEEFRQAENSRIAEGLKREELTEPLHALTGRYRSIRLDDDQGLVLVTDKDEDYLLASLSTGAREQIFLALRMGFASIAMEGETGFLILDDAFQHSDWDRREKLVDRTLSLVESGWQVFYFTMDDHLAGLFQDAGGKVGEGFRSHRLGED